MMASTGKQMMNITRLVAASQTIESSSRQGVSTLEIYEWMCNFTTGCDRIVNGSLSKGGGRLSAFNSFRIDGPRLSALDSPQHFILDKPSAKIDHQRLTIYSSYLPKVH